MPKAVDVDQKRAEFVAASWDVIAREGLKAATLRRVAAEAGCTTGALTHYFANRRALLIGALRSAHFQAGARMLARLEGDAPVREKLRAVLLESLPLDAVRVREWRVWLAFWAEAMNDAELASENDRRYEEWRALLEGLFSGIEGAANLSAQAIAFIDGLGLRVARVAPGDAAALSREQAACGELLDAWLASLRL